MQSRIFFFPVLKPDVWQRRNGLLRSCEQPGANLYCLHQRTIQQHLLPRRQMLLHLRLQPVWQQMAIFCPLDLKKDFKIIDIQSYFLGVG